MTNRAFQLAIDLFCGLGGWAEGLLAEGFEVIGFDIERHDYGTGGYPGQLVLQDVRTIHGSQFRDAAVIVASPPCQEYSYMAMPWSRAKAIAAEYRSGVRSVAKLKELFYACFRIQIEASHAAGRYIPLIVENVRGAQPWVGRAKWNYGSFYLWGDVPALMPITFRGSKVPGVGSTVRGEKRGLSAVGFNVMACRQLKADGIKNSGGSWFNVAHNTESGKGANPVNKTVGYVNKRDGYTHARHLTHQRESDAVKQHLSGPAWFDEGMAKFPSSSSSRKAASAQIAKIPLPLARHIARVYKPLAHDMNRAFPEGV